MLLVPGTKLLSDSGSHWKIKDLDDNIQENFTRGTFILKIREKTEVNGLSQIYS